MGLDPSAPLAAVGQAARNGQDRSLQTRRRLAIIPLGFFDTPRPPLREGFKAKNTFFSLDIYAMIK